MKSEDLNSFDISQEDAKTRAAYGSHTFGQGCLLARRLVENGVRFVEVEEGQNWDTARDAAVETVIDKVTEYAPNFRDSILGMIALTPANLEHEFGLVGGDIFHGALGLDQLFSARPMLGYGDYRGPLKGLYMCGSGTHPGGGVTGAPGHNAAREILKDFRRRKAGHLPG